MRRFIISMFTTAILATPLSANAATESCANALLDAPMEQLFATLQINDQQAAQLQTIRYQASSHRATLERQLEQVRAAREQAGPWAQGDLGQQEASLVAQLEAQPTLAVTRATQVLAPWQLSRCDGRVYYQPAPRVIVDRTPRIVVKPRVVVHRAPVYPKKRIVRRAPARPAPVVHHAPAPRPAPAVHRAPAPTPKWAPKPGNGPKPGKGPGKHNH